MQFSIIIIKTDEYMYIVKLVTGLLHAINFL